jgi:hypothetical protein
MLKRVTVMIYGMLNNSGYEMILMFNKMIILSNMLSKLAHGKYHFVQFLAQCG